MPRHAKGPPRHVPTLTDVVPEGLAPALAVPEAGGAEAGRRADDREVVPVPEAQEQAGRSALGAADCFLEKPPAVLEHESEEGPVALVPPAQALHAAAAPSRPEVVPRNCLPGGLEGALEEALEEALVQRILQRVDIALDQRVRAAIATVVQEQTRSLLPRLCEEVESIVRQVVSEAVADEAALGAGRTLQQG